MKLGKVGLLVADPTPTPYIDNRRTFIARHLRCTNLHDIVFLANWPIMEYTNVKNLGGYF